MKNKDLLIDSYLNIKPILNSYLKDIEQIVRESNCPLEGNSFYCHNTIDLYQELLPKQINLFWCGSQAQKICEIGFNAGHSALLMILGNKNLNNLHFTIFDINHHPYTKTCYLYLKDKFPSVNFEFIAGDSIEKIPQYTLLYPECLGTFDLVHIDGGHSEDCIKNDILNSSKLTTEQGIIIVDDTDHNVINNYVDKYLDTKEYEELNVLKTHGYCHRIIKKINK